MRWLFLPGAHVMGRLRYATKFGVVGLVLLLPLVWVGKAYVDGQQGHVASASKERMGIEYLDPLIALTGAAGQARHSAVTSAPRVDLAAGIGAVDAADQRLGAILGTTPTWTLDRTMLENATAATAPDSGYVAYNAAISGLLQLIIRVGDEANLTLDPNLDTFYLMDTLQFRLPLIVDTAGRMVDRAVLAQRSPRDDVVLALIELAPGDGMLQSARDEANRGIQTAAERTQDPTLAQRILPGMSAIDDVVNTLVKQLDAAISARDPRLVGVDAAAPVRTQIRGYAHTIAGQLDRLLITRIDSLNLQSGQVELISLVAVLIALYLFAGFYLSVVTPVRRMVAALQAVAAGDHNQVVEVDTSDELSYVAAALNDTIARTKIATDLLAEQATHDSLTGLPNRTLVLDRIDHAMARIQRSRGQIAVLFADLDGFKVVNDTIGHEAGDVVLRTVAERLRLITRATDTVARLAGDEFVIVCEDLAAETDAIDLARRVVASLALPITVQRPGEPDREIAMGASVGVALGQSFSSASATDLIRDADLAMYAAKKRGRGRVEIFDDRLRGATERRLELQLDLRSAVDSDQLLLHYQPVFDTASGRLDGFEALVRWQHPVHGLLSPGEFLPMAEDTGLVVPLGAWVIGEACRQLAAWRRGTPAARTITVGVNVSVRQLTDPSVLATVEHALRSNGIPASDLYLEITETAITTDEAGVHQTLEVLRGLGVRIAMDDFGTGYSSLAHLSSFHVDVLKVDRSLIQGVCGSENDRALVDMALRLARTMELDVVAEGVETPDQLEELRRLGCSKVQGYLLGRPVPPEEALAFLPVREARKQRRAS